MSECTGQENDGFNTDLERRPENQGKSAAEPSPGTFRGGGSRGVGRHQGGRWAPVPTAHMWEADVGTAWPWVLRSVRILLPGGGLGACPGEMCHPGKQDVACVWVPPGTFPLFTYFHPQIPQACFLSTRTVPSMTTAQLLRSENRHLICRRCSNPACCRSKVLYCWSHIVRLFVLPQHPSVLSPHRDSGGLTGRTPLLACLVPLELRVPGHQRQERQQVRQAAPRSAS